MSSNALRSLNPVAPLIGRERELEALAAALDGVGAGRGGIVGLSGAAGLGKTRLLAEARERKPEAVRWLEGRALSFSQTIAYWPFLEILRQWTGIADDDDTLESWVKLERRVRALVADDHGEYLPYLATLLGLPVPSELADRVRYLDGRAMGCQIMLTTRRFFEQLARRRPVALVFEDLQWLDRSSADLIHHLLPLVDAVPLLIVLVGRVPDGAEARASRSTRGGGLLPAALHAAAATSGRAFADIALTPLDAEASAQLARRLLGGASPPALTEFIVARAAGNPAAAEETVRALIAIGAAVPTIGGLELRTPVERLTLPDTLEGVAVARLDRLDDELGHALKLDALIGPGFLSRTLSAIAEADRALERHLAAGRRGAEIEILTERLRELHARVGECVETLFADRLDELSALLAYHFMRAESWEIAKDYLSRAGDHAGKLAADSEAVALYERALTTSERVLGEQWDVVERGVLQRKMGEALWRRGENDEAVEWMQRALPAFGRRRLPVSRWAVRWGLVRELAVHAGHRLLGTARRARRSDTAEVLQTPLRRPTVRDREAATIYSRVGWIDYFLGTERFVYDLLILLNESEASGYEYGVGEAAAALGLALDVIPLRRMAGHYHRRALAVAQDVGNPVLRGFANLARAFHAYFAGRLEEALEYFRSSATQYRKGGEIRGWASASQMVAWVLRLQGQFAASLEQSHAIAHVANDAGDTLGVAFALHGVGWTCWHLGNLSEAETHLRQSIDLYASLPNDQARAEAMADLAMCWLRQGRVAEAPQLAEDSTRIIDAAGLRGFNVTRPRLALAETALAAVPSCAGRARGRMLARARRACRAALHQARVDASALPAARRMWGTYLWLRGRPGGARRWWTNALATAEALGLPFEVALTWLEIGARLDDPAASRRGREALERLQARI
jgi:tetratricopeptide (TPR) repeat protein